MQSCCCCCCFFASFLFFSFLYCLLQRSLKISTRFKKLVEHYEYVLYTGCFYSMAVQCLLSLKVFTPEIDLFCLCYPPSSLIHFSISRCLVLQLFLSFFFFYLLIYLFIFIIFFINYFLFFCWCFIFVLQTKQSKRNTFLIFINYINNKD